MFGFLKGNTQNQQYRSLYARACQCHFSEHGRLAALFHSYEAVFLFSLASDLGLIRQPSSQDAVCCQLRGRFQQDDQETKVGEFCAAFAMLLVRIKLQDDWNDDRSLASRLALRVFAKPIRRSEEYFRSLDQDFHATLSSILLAHQRLEQNRGAVSLEQFQSATREGFAYIFGLFAKQWLGQSMHRDFERIGGELGAAIIAFDCATDWKADQRRGRYNPLSDSAEISQAYLECGRCLSRASWLCHQLAADNCEQPLIADQIVRRWLRHSLQLAQQRELSNLPVAKRSNRARWPQTALRLRSPHALRRGDCGICCVVEACDVVSCCDPVCCERTCCQSDKKKSKQDNQSVNSAFLRQSSQADLSRLIGSRGVTSGPLNPAGLVTIENTIYPASSQSGLYIDAGEAVTVVAIDSFGLKVNATM